MSSSSRPRRARILTVFVLIGAAVATSIVTLGIDSLKETEQTAVEEFNLRQLIVAAEARNGIDLYFELLVFEMRQLGRHRQIRRFNSTMTRRELADRFAGLAPLGVHDVAIIDAEGIVRFAAEDRQLEGSDFSSRASFVNAQQRTLDDAYFVEFVELTELEPGEHGFVIAVPWFNESTGDDSTSTTTSLGGLVICSLSVDFVADRFLSPTGVSENSYGLLVNGENRVLWSPDSSLIGAEMTDLLIRFSRPQNVLDAISAGRTGTGSATARRFDPESSSFLEGQQEQRLFAFTSLEVGDQTWSIWTTGLKGDARVPIQKAYLKLLFLIGIATLAILVAVITGIVSFRRVRRVLGQQVKRKTRELNVQLKTLRKTEKLAQESEARYRSLADSTTDIIIRFGRHGKIQYANPSFEELVKIGAESCLGKTCREVNLPEELAVSLQLVQHEVHQTGQSVATEFHVTREHQTRWYDWRLFPEFDEKGQLTSVLSVSRDVTERKAAEERIRQTQKLNAIAQLAGGIAHDFNNQLTGILGYAELLEMVAEDERLKRYANMIIRGVQKSSELTKELLAYSRRRRYYTDSIDAHSVLRKVISSLQTASHPNIDISSQLNATTAKVLGDAEQLQGAIMNLGVNALESMPDGGTLTIVTQTVTPDAITDRSALGDNPTDQYLSIQVIDTGVGMDKETCDHVFEPFFTTKPPEEGAGMGLAVVYGVVRSHRGTIDVESEPGKGSVFTLYLPVAKAEGHQTGGK